jgi:NAD+ kinase
MRIALFGKRIPEDAAPFLEQLHNQMRKHEVETVVFESFAQIFADATHSGAPDHTFANAAELAQLQPDFLIAIGGDGTILDAATLVCQSGIPILGINTGRLGFLANVPKDRAKLAAKALISGDFRISERNLVHLKTYPEHPLEPAFGLNEVTVSRKDTTSMITIHTWINGEYLNSYWADGLIIATPTGSTGYSLSCGGPIIMPGSENFVITPIAPHNLNVRPFVIPNSYTIRLKVEGRSDQFLVSLDSRIMVMDQDVELEVHREKFKLKLVQMGDHEFASTLRNKLLWGIDRRN